MYAGKEATSSISEILSIKTKCNASLHCCCCCRRFFQFLSYSLYELLIYIFLILGALSLSRWMVDCNKFVDKYFASNYELDTIYWNTTNESNNSNSNKNGNERKTTEHMQHTKFVGCHMSCTLHMRILICQCVHYTQAVSYRSLFDVTCSRKKRVKFEKKKKNNNFAQKNWRST